MNRQPWLPTSGRGLPFRLLAGVVASALALLVATSGVIAHGPDPALTGGRWNQNQALTYSWRAGSVPDPKYQTPVNAAAADANASRASQAATFAYRSGSSNLIGYGTGATCTSIGIACFSRNAPTSFSIWMREQGHKFDWGALRWCQNYSTWPDGCYDVENVMLDEFGHVEILSHHSNYTNEPDYTDAVVQEGSRTKPRTGWNAHVFARCDVATLQKQYDMQGWVAKYSTCLDLATTLTLGANAGSVGYGGTVTLTATLKVADDATYSRLAANPVNARNVTLESRPTGGTWASLGAMTNGSTSGTYTKAVQLTAKREFRAVFPKPSGEGLRGSISGTVVVAIGP